MPIPNEKSARVSSRVRNVSKRIFISFSMAELCRHRADFDEYQHAARFSELDLTTGEKLIKNHRFEIIEAAS
jgi:hypothetical protein